MGKTRKIGSIDICAVCGKEYTVSGGLQKYCPDCSAEAIAAKDRIKSREWNALHIDYDEQRENRHDSTAFIPCVICGKSFRPSASKQLTCSPECREAFAKNRNSQYHHDNRDAIRVRKKNQLSAKIASMSPEEYREYRDGINAKAREAYKRRKEKGENQ